MRREMMAVRLMAAIRAKRVCVARVGSKQEQDGEKTGCWVPGTKRTKEERGERTLGKGKWPAGFYVFRRVVFEGEGGEGNPGDERLGRKEA